MSNDFEILIHNDIVAVICKFLRPKDILTLYHMYPTILKKVSNIYIKRVGQEIDMFFRWTFGKNYLEFRKAMVSSNAMLSGSIILQIILGERWAGHPFDRLDVDIFVRVDPIYTNNDDNMDDEHTFYNYKYKFKLGYTELHKFLHKRKDRKNAFSGYVTHSQYRDELGENVIVRINDYVIRQKNIFQVVELNSAKHDSYLQFINETVDFDICKNFFRYITTEDINDTNDGIEISIQNLHNIINKVTTFNFVHDITLSKKRKEKYMERGFTFF